MDAATKGDCAAVVAVARGEDGRVRLVRHRVWTPRFGQPLDLERTVEAFLLDLRRDYRIASVVFDPYQMARSAVTLERAGLRMRELPQNPSNLTAAGQNLFDLIRERRLVVYSDKELRQHALNAVAVETARGWRLAKEKASRKIDGLAALSFACLDAVERPPSGPVKVLNPNRLGRLPDPVGRETTFASRVASARGLGRDHEGARLARYLGVPLYDPRRGA